MTNENEEEAIVPVSQEKEPVPVDERSNHEKTERESKPGSGNNIGRILRGVLRVIMWIVVLGGIAAGFYFGWPLVYERYIRPVEENTSGLDSLESRQSDMESLVADLQSRISTLEAGQSANDSSLAEIDTRVQTLESADVERSESLVELTYQADLLRVMELLSRGRLFLYQSNFGLARLDVQAAYDLLEGMQAAAPPANQADITEALFRLDLVLKNLPAFPVAASDDLDIAWQILMDGYPALPTETPAPTEVSDSTATPEPTPTATP